MKRLLSLFCLLALTFCGCAAPSEQPQRAQEGLTLLSSLPLSYAQCFSVDFYEGGYTALRMDDERAYLVIPEGAAVPEGAEEYILLRQPLEHIYLTATAAMSQFDALERLDAIAFTGTRAEGWYVENAALAMERGDILYAGKYSAPDYEQLVAKQCDLSVQSTQVYHAPEVQDKLEEMGIPVFIDRSSYENHPLGRAEWIKAYGALLGCVEEAQAYFDQQVQTVEQLSALPSTGKTVAFFYVTQDGTVSVRKASDYLPAMIELSGGQYAFSHLDAERSTATITLSLEDFYLAAKDADYFLYNANIDTNTTSLQALLEKSPLFQECKAVREGQVWCTGRELFQATDQPGEIIKEMHQMLSGTADPSAMRFVYPLT